MGHRWTGSIQAGCWRDPPRRSERRPCERAAGSRGPEPRPSAGRTLAAAKVEEKSDITVSKVSLAYPVQKINYFFKKKIKGKILPQDKLHWKLNKNIKEMSLLKAAKKVG